jgi:predicted nuclease of predicted toxin-antitoxin system
MRFLVDECLSPDLVTIAHQNGREAYHVAHLGKAGWKDWNVVRHACDNNFVVVTNNAVDFRRLYADEAIHPGPVILISNVERPIQQELFQFALTQLAAIGELINGVLEVDLDGEEIVVNIYDLPEIS